VNLQKNVLDDIEKDVTDVTGRKEVMGGSVQVENQFSHDNIDDIRSSTMSLTTLILCQIVLKYMF
jgi:hypothetical protein